MNRRKFDPDNGTYFPQGSNLYEYLLYIMSRMNFDSVHASSTPQLVRTVLRVRRNVFAFYYLDCWVSLPDGEPSSATVELRVDHACDTRFIESIDFGGISTFRVDFYVLTYGLWRFVLGLDTVTNRTIR